jgi:hypothetical protein
MGEYANVWVLEIYISSLAKFNSNHVLLIHFPIVHVCNKGHEGRSITMQRSSHDLALDANGHIKTFETRGICDVNL